MQGNPTVHVVLSSPTMLRLFAHEQILCRSSHHCHWGGRDKLSW